MRTKTEHFKSIKSTYRHKVHKKKHRSRSALGCTPAVSSLDLENINEVIRANRAYVKKQRAEGSWKVVPKDSCEVYKERRKRQAENNRRGYEEEDADMHTDSEADARGRRKRREDRKHRRGTSKKTRTKRKSKCRCQENSSISSYTTATTSYLSSSEMEY